MRLSYSLGSLLTIEQALECSKKLDKLKPDTVWIPETWGMENFSMLSLVSKENLTSKIGSSIINIYSRSPSLIAMGAVTVDTISNGRLILGLGTSSQPLVEDFHGSKFEMYKFRTMYKDSHVKRADLKDSNEKSGPLFKITSDPRIINGLEFLRTYSLDELPQLFNVLKGNMSLVGPRPLFEEDTEYFDKNYIRRLNVLPGMTGLLQVNERNTDDFEIWYKYDIEYIDNWSLYLDIKILLKTFTAVINKRNTGS